MSLKLLVTAGPDKGSSFLLKSGHALLLGRAKSTEARLNDPAVSKVHCQVTWDGARVIVADQGSTHGTFVNGARVTQQILKPGDTLRLGETQLSLQDDGLRDDDEAEGATRMLNLAAVVRTIPTAAEILRQLSGQSMSHYLVGPVLAEGQSGMIFRADDTKQRRAVALKVLWPDLCKNDRLVQRFVRAMKTMLPVRHPNLVAVYGAGRAGPYCWCAMEYVEGESLTKIIQRVGTGGKLDWWFALRVAVQIGRALEHAHGLGIIHRNLTPENVLVRRSDQVAKLGDVMLAKAQEGMPAENVTRPGELLGDVRFSSPERMQSDVVIDGRSDLYSLGALVYALLTGRAPLEGATIPETIVQIRQAEPVPPTRFQPSVPAGFEQVVMKLLRKEPEQRYATATKMLQELERIAAAERVTV